MKELVSKNRVEPGDRVIKGVIEEDALKGTLRLKANGKWIQIHMVNTRGKLTSHTKILDRIINAIALSKDDQDSMTTTNNLDPNFVVDILTNKDYKVVEPINHINFHTEGSKLDDNRAEAGVFINNSHNVIAEEAIHLGNNATVFQDEEQHPTLYSLKSKKKILS